MKVDPSVEPAQRIEEEPAHPVTPVLSRTRPEEPIATGDLGSWTSPAFFQRSRASFGVDSRLDPFAEEDGFVPGKGRKRPRFSMRSSEWRFIDEPADPDEKGSPVDWTQELEDEIESEPEPRQPKPESKVDKERIAEVVGTSQETPITTGPSPGAEAIPPTTTEETAITGDRPTPELSADVEQPAEQDVAKAADVGREAHEKGLRVNGLHIPMDTPRLLPIPSPGLPIPSPLVSADNRQGYFSSTAATIAQLSAPQQSTIATQYEPIRVEENVEMRTQITRTEIIGAPVSQTTHESAAVYFHDTASKDPVASVAPKPGVLIAEDDVQADERHETAATDVYQDESSPSPVEEEPHIEHIAIQPPEDVEMEDAECPLTNKKHESEDEEEDDGDSQEEASDEESGVEEIEGESENESEEDEEEEEEEKEKEEDDEEEGYRANQAVDMRSHELHNGQYATDSTENPNKTAQSQTEAYSKSRGQRHHIEEDDEEADVEKKNENEEDEEIDDEEASEGDYESGYVYEDDDEDGVDSESESDDEQYQVQPPQNNTKPEIIVLDSDDENEQPAASSQAQTRAPPIQGQPASDQEESDDESHAEEEDWTSDEKGEDEVMAEREYDDEKAHHVEDEDEDDFVEDDDEDDYSMDEEEGESAEGEAMRDEKRAVQVEMVERTCRTENEQIAELASNKQEQGSLAEDEQKQDGQEHNEQEVEATTPAEYEIATSPDIDEEPPSEKHHEEAHVTEDLLQYSEQHLDEHSPTHTPRETTPEAALFQSEPIRDDAGSSGRQGVEDTSEVRIEEPLTIVELDQDKDSGLWYDGARSPRVGHNNTTNTTETLESSGLSLHDRQADDTLETEYGHQDFENHSINEKAIASQEHAPSHEQTELLAEDNEAMVEAPDVPEAKNVLPTTEQEPRSRSASVSEYEWVEANEYTVGEDTQAQEEQEPRSPSASISQHEWAEANEYTADEAQEAADGETSLQLQLQDETRIRKSIEESDSYTQNPAGPDRRYPGLRSKNSYYAPLSTLVDHLDALIDAISVISETSPIIRSASGNKDYSLTLYLTDPSMVGTTITAQIFRPHLEAIPSVSEGDIVLLRNFKVKSFNHYMMLVSADTSAWAVFKPSQDETQMTGPPIEYDEEERTHVSYLRDWYQSNGAAMIADNQLQASIVEASREMTPMSSVAASDTASLDDFPGREGRRDSTRRDRRGRKSHRRITIHELRDGRRYTEIGSPSDPESIHELRDGTVYAHL